MSPQAVGVAEYKVDWERVISDAAKMMVNEQGCTAEEANKAIRQALQNPSPIPWPED